MRVAAMAVVCLSAMAAAHGAPLSGRLKVEETAFDAGPSTPQQALGYQTTSQLAGQLRVAVDRHAGRFAFDAALQLDGRRGSEVTEQRALAAAYPALAQTAPDESRWDLQHVITDSGETDAGVRLDRLNLSWSGDHLVVRVGRQALTWGSGLVFHPMDLVNPFEPVATDTVYKRGTDMAYAQWLFDDGSDVQFAGVLRRRRGAVNFGTGKNTWAAFANIVGDTTQWTLLAARNRSDTVLGGGVTRSLLGAVGNAELVATRTPENRTAVSLLANLSWATVWRNRNLTVFAEYYRNGFGLGGRHYAASAIGPELLARLQRGDVFVTGRDYLSLGARLSLTPLIQVSPTAIVNLRDHSALMDVQLAWSLSDNTSLKGGVRFAAGARGTELGGLRVIPGAGIYLARPDQAFVRLEHYF